MNDICGVSGESQNYPSGAKSYFKITKIVLFIKGIHRTKNEIPNLNSILKIFPSIFTLWQDVILSK
jgi:hypothetical protein